MFKPLLRTLPTLSGNITLACKLNEFKKDGNNDFHTYVKYSNFVPLQNNVFDKNIELNMLNGKYEYDIAKFYNIYSNIFYNENFIYNKKNYALLDLDSLYDSNNDARNKDYEFGCKRIKYSQSGYQFMFYAPFYIDNVNDLPKYFLLHIKFNDHLVKRIKIYINEDYKHNYLGKYIKEYVQQFDDRCIFCLPDSLQATYFGIDVKHGGLIQYKDNEIGALYVNQTTINNFDNTICEGFKRNKLVMSQVIPLSFMFNVNDLLNDYEKEFFEGYNLNIYGYYCSNNDIEYPFYDFDINYTHAYNKYLKYDEYTGKYSYSFGKSDLNENVNILNVGYPALNESKYIKYAYTNKITPRYCKFKMLLSSDNDPYITNLNYGYTYLQNPNQKYGYFPTMFKGIYPQAYVNGKDLRLPIGNDLEKYYKTSKYYANTVQINAINIDKYIKLMTNYTSSWYTINHKISESVFDDRTLWSDVKYNYTYYKGILYNLSELNEYNIDKFSVFLNPELKYVNESNITNSIVKANNVLSKTNVGQYSINNYNDSYLMKTNVKMNIDSISLTGPQYIDTEVIPDDTYGIEIDFSTDRIMDCAYIGLVNASKNGTRYFIGCDKNGFYVGWGGFQYLGVPYSSKRHKIQLNYMNDRHARITGADMDGEVNITLDNLPFTPEYSIWIGAANWGGKLHHLYPSKIYGVRITKGTELIHEYVPIEKDGYGYLQDNITGEILNTLKNKGILDVAQYEGTSYAHYNKIYDLNSTSSESYISINKMMKQDSYGSYIEETNYDEENTYYKYEDIYRIISINFSDTEILNELDTFKIKGYYLLDAQNNINYFETYYDAYNNEYKRFMLTENLFGTNDYNETYNWFKDSLYYVDIRSTNKKPVKDSYEDIDYNEDIYGKLAFFITDNYIHKNDVYNFIYNNLKTNINLDFIINQINNLTRYSFVRYSEENGILLKDYFIKMPINYCSVYVDPYNLNTLISEYNRGKSAQNKLSLIDSKDKTSDMFVKIINKDHLIEYCKKLNGNENGIMEFERKPLFNYIYVKNRNWIIDNNVIDIKDTYITLDEFILKYKLTYKDKLDESGNYTDEYKILLSFADEYNKVKNTYTLYESIDWFCKLLSDNRSSKNNFILNIANREVTVDLCFKKKMILLNDNIMKLMYDNNSLNNYLMLYIIDTAKNTNNDIWNILSLNELNGKIYENIDNYLTPLFTSPYVNDFDKSTIYSMISKGKIKDYKYIYNVGKNFKEINILDTIKSIVHEDKIDTLNKLISDNGLSLNWYEYVMKDGNDEDNEIYEMFAKDIISELNYVQIQQYINLKIDFLYKYNLDLFYKFVKSNNITLYSIYDIMSIKYDVIAESDISSDDIEYIEKYNMFIYNHNGLNYGFYYLNFNLDNTNNSFNIINDYNLNIQFDTINGKDIQSYSSEYFDSIFPILHPFMKTNIFNEFVKDNVTIIYPYEAEILIKYATAKSNELLQNQFAMLKDNESDVLYDVITKLSNEKKIKLLRYFNYITPYLKETNTINDCWQLKFMKPNNFEDIEKYSIFYKDDINIYKYNGIKVYSGDFNKVTLEYDNYETINQYEYKHFNDNSLYNLPEEIVIEDDTLYSSDDIELLKDKNFLIDRKKQILLRYFTKKKLNYKDIILFLYNKYESGLFIEKKRLNAIKNEYTYKISYKFTLI